MIIAEIGSVHNGDVNKALFNKSKKPLSYRPNYKYKL